MKEKDALKLASKLTSIKTINDVYFPVQLVRKDEDDMMIILQTTAPIGADQYREFKDLGKSYNMRIAGTFIAYE